MTSADGLPSLDDLIRTVRDAAPEDPLEQLAEAARRKEELAEIADTLLGHFVDQARRAGCSWSQIGDALGVSKQAAQQRHTSQQVVEEAKASVLQDFSRFTDRARTSINEAQAAAVRLQHNYVGTEHLLLGLLAVPEGVAGKILAENDITTEKVEEFVLEVVGRGGAKVSAAGQFTPRAAACLVKSLTEAVTLGHNYIGTEHILLGLFGEKQGLAAKLMRSEGLTKNAAQQRVVQMLVAFTQK